MRKRDLRSLRQAAQQRKHNEPRLVDGEDLPDLPPEAWEDGFPVAAEDRPVPDSRVPVGPFDIT